MDVSWLVSSLLAIAIGLSLGLLGGGVAVESEVGKGSVFRVFLPLRPGEHPPPAAA